MGGGMSKSTSNGKMAKTGTNDNKNDTGGGSLEAKEQGKSTVPNKTTNAEDFEKKKMADESIVKSRFEAVRQILADETLKRAFMLFLCSESTERLEPKSPTERILPLKSVPPEQIQPLATLLIENCNFTMRSELPDLANSIGGAFCNTTDYTMLLRPADVVAISIEVYPSFLQSSFYEKWKQQSDTTKISNARQAEIVSQMPFQSIVESKIFTRALGTADKQEVERIIQAGSVLSAILVAVETLPVCVSISTARKDRPGFPLIYVNNCFEQVTGYQRSEIVGQNCRFLQAGKCEQEAVKRLSNALKNAKPVKVAITNFRKDGMPFKNLLSMKPIFDENGEYCYVVGVQFDVTQSDATPAKLKLADDVINMLPNVIISTSSTNQEE